MSCDKLSTRIEAIEKNLDGLTPIDKRRCMYKVHKQLRNVNENAYKPVLLAIGPFNDHGEVGEGFMEEHKLRYLQQLLKRTKASVEKYMKTLRKLEKTARICYVECNLERDEFVEMMLLDGCFIIELFRKYEIYRKTEEEDNPEDENDSTPEDENDSIPEDENDPILKMKWVLPRIARDLLLFENQLPFFVLSKLFEMSESNGSRKLEEDILDIEEKEGIISESSTSTAQTQNIPTRLNDLALNFFSRFVPFKWNLDASSYNSTEKIKHLLSLTQKTLTASLPQMVEQRLAIGFKFKKAEFEHLLGLIHTSICISILDTEIDQAKERQEKNIGKAISSASESQKSGLQDNYMIEIEDNWESIPFGSELLKAGVEFNMAKRFFDDLNEIDRWSAIPHGFELLKAGIDFDKANKFKDLLDQNRTENQCERGSQIDGIKLKLAEKFMHILCLNNVENWKLIPYGKELREAGIEFNKAKKFKCLHAIEKVESWNIHGATELEEAGIKFKKAEKWNKFSIMFKNGIMEISPLMIEDSTEAFLRNLVAYEQYCDRDINDFNYVNNYVRFMDNLINSPKDVELLRRRGIILNYMGDDDVISTMVSKLGDNIFISNRSSIYARTSKEINMHCRKRWNVWMAKLRRDYFNSPWALVSFLGAILLLALTIAQTIFSIIP